MVGIVPGKDAEEEVRCVEVRHVGQGDPLHYVVMHEELFVHVWPKEGYVPVGGKVTLTVRPTPLAREFAKRGVNKVRVFWKYTMMEERKERIGKKEADIPYKLTDPFHSHFSSAFLLSMHLIIGLSG